MAFLNYSEDYYTFEDDDPLTPALQPAQIISLVCYSIVVLLGVPGNALVVWVTGFCMPHSVTSLWFLNLALADFLCCLTLPLLMVPLVHDDHWSFGSLGCPILKGLLYMMMYSSVLQLVLISVDRYLLVTKPVWCQNKRRPRAAVWGCVLVWFFAVVGSIPQFVTYKEVLVAGEKKECRTSFPTSIRHSKWLFYAFRSLMGFVLPFLVIAVCHWKVYQRAEGGLSRGNRSKRTLKIIVAVIVSFFLCWIPLHIVDFIYLNTDRHTDAHPKVIFAHTMAVCLAYANSCLNPLLYVCLGRDFKNRVNRSMRSFLNFATEDPQNRASVTNDVSKSTSTTKEMTKI